MLRCLKNRYLLSVLGMLSIALYFFSFFLVLTSGLIMLVKIAGFLISALAYCLFNINLQNRSIKKQLVPINIVIFIYHFLIGLITYKVVFFYHHYSAITFIIVWTATPIVLIIWGFIHDRTIFTELFESMRSEKALLGGALIIAAVVIVCSCDIEGPKFLWDSNLAYNFILRYFEPMNLLEPKKMVFCSHIAFSYFYPAGIFSTILGSIDYGFFFFTSCMIVIASLGFALLFRSVFPNEKKWILILATAVSMLSPYIFALSTLQMYDYIAICITPFLLWTVIDDKKALFFAAGAFACFLKEPGIVYFGSICAALILWELVSEKTSIRLLLQKTEYWFYMLIGAVFVTLYLTFGNYATSQNEGFGVSVSHIIGAVKMFCVLNYTWVLTVLALIFTVYSLLSSSAGPKLKRASLLVSLPAIAFLALNSMLMAGYNPRYTDFFYPSLLILSVMFILAVLRKTTQQAVLLGIMAGLFILADFTSLDPVSDLMIPKVDIGNTKLYSVVGPRHFADSTVYNRQYYGYDVAMNMAINKALENNDEVLAVSAADNEGAWQVSGKWDVGTDLTDFEEYWDINRKRREPGFSPAYHDNPNLLPIMIKYIYANNNTVDELKKSRSFTYIYMPSLNEGREDLVRSEFDIISEGTFTSRGWVIAYIQGKCKEQKQ